MNEIALNQSNKDEKSTQKKGQKEYETEDY